MPEHVTYTAGHFPEPKGFLFFDVEDGPCTITLTPAASADQKWVDKKGQEIAEAMNSKTR